MKLYHGTSEKFKKFDFSKSTEVGFCFAPEVSAARYYGDVVYTVELNTSKTLNIATKMGAQEIIDLCPELKVSIDEIRKDETDCENTEEFLEDEFSYFTDYIEETGNRDELLIAARNAGYDCVLIDDYTDGDHHETYIALDENIITTLN